MTCEHGFIDPKDCGLCRRQVNTDLMQAYANDLPTVKAARALVDAATDMVAVLMADRVPMTRPQTLALLKLANAALHLEALLPPV